LVRTGFFQSVCWFLRRKSARNVRARGPPPISGFTRNRHLKTQAGQVLRAQGPLARACLWRPKAALSTKPGSGRPRRLRAAQAAPSPQTVLKTLPLPRPPVLTLAARLRLSDGDDPAAPVASIGTDNSLLRHSDGGGLPIRLQTIDSGFCRGRPHRSEPCRRQHKGQAREYRF
jgi:hypothetical protein